MQTHNKVAVKNSERLRRAEGLLPDDHVTMLGMYWKLHPMAEKTIKLVEKIQRQAAIYKLPIVGVTGASGSGKDSCVEAVPYKVHMRFGDFMKDWAHELGMVPHDREHYETYREARFEELWNGKTPLDAWIALDVIRHYNPFVFVEAGLQKVLSYIRTELSLKNCLDTPIIFSGMRTELGLDVVADLGAKYIRVERDGHEPPKNATLDELQVIYPVDVILENNDTLEAAQKKFYELIH